MRQLFARGDGGIAARMLAGMDSFMRKQKAAQEGGEAVDRYKLIEAAREKMKSAIANVGVWRAEANADAETKAQFALVNPDSHYDYSKSFAEQVEDWKNGVIPEKSTLVIGGTPKVLQEIGFPNLPLTFKYDHLIKSFGDPEKGTGRKNKDHILNDDFLKRIPDILENPIAIIENRPYGNANETQKRLEFSVLVVFAENNPESGGLPYIGSFSITTGGRVNELDIDMNRVNTIHSPGNLENLVYKAVEVEKAGGVGVYYINKKALLDLNFDQLHELEGLELDGFVNSIADPNSPVKYKPIKQTQTRVGLQYILDNEKINRRTWLFRL